MILLGALTFTVWVECRRLRVALAQEHARRHRALCDAERAAQIRRRLVENTFSLTDVFVRDLEWLCRYDALPCQCRVVADAPPGSGVAFGASSVEMPGGSQRSPASALSWWRGPE
jgi:hypothetical protein